MLRTHNLGEVNEKLVGEKVKLVGWVDSMRDHGNVLFIDLRDSYGKIQTVITKKNSFFENARKLTSESCIQLEGKVGKRPKGTENKEISSGKVELGIDKLKILSSSAPLPFELNAKNLTEDIRLKYRYLDLRRDKMQKNLITRYRAVKFIRDHLDEENFIEITTPILTKSSPEGARDFIVPSRLHPGKFYALPQSPQQYKQMLMVGGFDKYFQIAPCFRDEDARADRSPGEFYQLDLEMAFAEQKDILDIIEKLFIEMVKKEFPDKKISKIPFPRLRYDEVMKKYGTDKPDLRKNKKDPNELAFCFVVDFPLFEEKMERGNYAPMHHMFTMPKEGDWKLLTKKDAKKAKSHQHDFVLNGFEIGGGSIRIHKAEIQEKIFDLIGFDEKKKKYFSHMLTAFKYGVPPHGGIALGIDRLLMAIMGEPNIRELIAFPKNKEAKDVTFGAPDEVSNEQLKETHISISKKKSKKNK